MEVKLKSICVFAGSNGGFDDRFMEAATDLGQCLASRDLTLVYGAGNIGLMGAVADAAMAAGGKVIGIIPDFLMQMEVAHEGLTELHVVGSMHERKKLMSDLSDGVIALPGGLGTLEELFEMLTWLQLGVHSKPIAVLNAAGFYDELLSFLNHLETSGFIMPEQRQMLISAADPLSILDAMSRHQAPSVSKWLEEVKT